HTVVSTSVTTTNHSSPVVVACHTTALPMTATATMCTLYVVRARAPVAATGRSAARSTVDLVATRHRPRTSRAVPVLPTSSAVVSLCGAAVPSRSAVVAVCGSVTAQPPARATPYPATASTGPPTTRPAWTRAAVRSRRPTPRPTST